MKILYAIFTTFLLLLLGCSSMVPHQNSIKLNSSYTETPAFDNTFLEVKAFISFKPGFTKFVFPIGLYKPIEKTKGYVYYLSPSGTFVDAIGSSYYVKGGIKLNVETGDLKFISMLGALPVGKQNIHDYRDKIVLKKRMKNDEYPN